MIRYHTQLKKYYPPNYFYGLKSYERRRYINDEKKEYISLTELIKEKYDRDVLKIIYEYYKQMKPIMRKNYIRKIKKEFNYRVKYLIYRNFSRFPENIIDYNWWGFLNNLINEFIVKYSNHLICGKEIKHIFCCLSEEICITQLKAVFNNMVGINNLVYKNKCRCGCKTFNIFLRNINKNTILNMRGYNYFDDFFYENNLNDLYITIRKFYEETIKIEFNIIDNKYIRLRYMFPYKDRELYKKLVTHY